MNARADTNGMTGETREGVGVTNVVGVRSGEAKEGTNVTSADETEGRPVAVNCKRICCGWGERGIAKDNADGGGNWAKMWESVAGEEFGGAVVSVFLKAPADV